MLSVVVQGNDCSLFLCAFWLESTEVTQTMGRQRNSVIFQFLGRAKLWRVTLYRRKWPYGFIHEKMTKRVLHNRPNGFKMKENESQEHIQADTGDFEPIGTLFAPFFVIFLMDEPIGSFSPVQGAGDVNFLIWWKTSFLVYSQFVSGGTVRKSICCILHQLIVSSGISDKKWTPKYWPFRIRK